jgi:transposase
MKSIGLDLHAASFTLVVLNGAGQVEKHASRATSGAELIEVLKEIRGPKTLIVEESHLAQWAKRTVKPYVDEFIICDPTRNAWIARDEFNDDRSSALKLARLHQGGFLKEIHHPEGPEEELRSLFLHYYDLGQQAIRFKNKVKAVFRQEAIRTSDQHFYDTEGHEAWLGKLRGVPHLALEARQDFAMLDLLEQQRQELLEGLRRRARQRPAYKFLETVPGIGVVIGVGYLALIETAHRFSRKNKLWRYAGMANQRQISDDHVYVDGPSASGNRPLKWLVHEHFHAAVLRTKASNRFKRQYEQLLARRLTEAAAERHVKRTLLSVVRAVWKKGEAYRDDLVK